MLDCRDERCSVGIRTLKMVIQRENNASLRCVVPAEVLPQTSPQAASRRDSPSRLNKHSTAFNHLMTKMRIMTRLPSSGDRRWIW